MTTLAEPDRISVCSPRCPTGWPAATWAPLPAEDLPADGGQVGVPPDAAGRHIGKIVCQIPKPLAPNPDRSYLITGGLGAIGLHTAAYLAQLGAGDIVLTSRHAPDDDARQAIADITERHRCRVHVFTADVGDESEVARLLERIRAELPPLAGVAHLAASSTTRCCPSRPSSVPKPPWRQRHSAPATLDRLTKQDDLDFFIMSSRCPASSAHRDRPTIDRERPAGRAGRMSGGEGPARDRRQLQTLGRRRHGQFGCRDRNHRRAGPDSAGTVGRAGALAEVVANGTGRATVINASWQRAAKLLGASRRSSTSCCRGLPPARWSGTTSCSNNYRRSGGAARGVS